MVQLVNAFGCKITRNATCMIPCPICHKKRQARRTWRFVDHTIIVVCPDCYESHDDRHLLKICQDQGWITICHNWLTYDYRTALLKGVTITV